MAQGILERRQFPPEAVNPAARPAVEALRAGRYQAWLRARSLAFRRSVINPVTTFWAWLILALQPAAYLMWRAACVAVVSTAVAAESVALAAVRIADAVQLGVRSVHFSGVQRLKGALVLTGLSVVVFTYGFYGMGLEVFVNGESMGYVYSQSQFERAVVNVSERASDILKTPFAMEPNVTYRYSLVSRSKLFDSREVENLLFAQIPELKILDVLSINGEAVAGVEQKGVIKEQLNAVLGSAAESGVSSFVADVTVSRQLAPRSIEMSPEELNELLTSDVLPAFYAETHGADTADLARSYGMTEEALLALNPHIEAGEVNEQKVLINYAKPLLEVQVTRTQVYTEVVPFETTYVDDPNMYKDRTRTVTKGVDGYNTVTADVSYVSGHEHSREILNVENTLEPVNEVIAQGTLTPPTFIRPFYGKYTSGYGMRDLFDTRRMHQGVDFAGAIGSPIVASCGGKVTFSGWKNGYGNCVIISHGNGLSTLYGHNSKNLVKVGDKVEQGDLIARVGNTGRSTGPHVHFEVRVNDKPVNPWNYIK